MREAVVIDFIGGQRSSLDHTLFALADRLARLAPSHRHPSRFHEDKSEIVYELERLAAEVRCAGPSRVERRGVDGTRKPPRLAGGQ